MNNLNEKKKILSKKNRYTTYDEYYFESCISVCGCNPWDYADSVVSQSNEIHNQGYFVQNVSTDVCPAYARP